MTARTSRCRTGRIPITRTRPASASPCSRSRPTASASATRTACRGVVTPSTAVRTRRPPASKVQYDTGMGYAFAGAKSAVVLDQPHRRTALGARRFGRRRRRSDRHDPARGQRWLLRPPQPTTSWSTSTIRRSGCTARPRRSPCTTTCRSAVVDRLPALQEQRRAGVEPVRSRGLPGRRVVARFRAEYTILGQTLKDPDQTGVTKIQYGHAGDVNVRVKIDRRPPAVRPQLPRSRVHPALGPQPPDLRGLPERLQDDLRTTSPPPASTRTGATG